MLTILYSGLIWVVASVALGLVVGATIRLADRRCPSARVAGTRALEDVAAMGLPAPRTSEEAAEVRAPAS